MSTTSSLTLAEEFLSTVLWAYFSSWTFGLPALFPSARDGWLHAAGFNGPALFFLWCIVFYELKVPGTTNPGYWLRDVVSDYYLAALSPDKTLARPRVDPRRAAMLAVVDFLGWLCASCLYLMTLRMLNQTAMYEASLRPPRSDSHFIIGSLSEILVTSTTMLCGMTAARIFRLVSPTTPTTELEKRTAGSVINVLSSFGGVRIMVYGMPYSGAAMNPASSFASTFWWLRWAEHKTDIFLSLIHVLIVYVLSPVIGAAIAGFIEANVLLMESRAAPKTTTEGPTNNKPKDDSKVAPPVLTPKILPMPSEKENTEEPKTKEPAEKKEEEDSRKEDDDDELPENDDDLTDIDEILADHEEEAAAARAERDKASEPEASKKPEEGPAETSEATKESDVSRETEEEQEDEIEGVVSDKKND